MKELESIAPLLEHAPRFMPYTLPDNYFITFPEAMLTKIRLKDNRGTVPDGYFETLPAILLDKIRTSEVKDELDTVAPFLNTISKEPVQAIPAGYFDSFSIPAINTVQQTARVIPFQSRKGWLKYGVAACIAALICFTALNILKTKKAVVASVDIAKELTKVKDSTIEAYLTRESLTAEPALVAFQPVKDEDIQGFLEEFSDEELQQHLQQEGEALTYN